MRPNSYYCQLGQNDIIRIKKVCRGSYPLTRPKSKKNKTAFHYVLVSLYTILITLFLFFLVQGLEYYLTPISQRPHHPEFRVLKPAGQLGLRFGIVGTVMMTCLLMYSLRKRTGLFGNLFRLKYWLAIHIWCGVGGPLFILLHTSFKLNGLVAVSFWSMMGVALSGLFGRYLYIQIPQNIRGEQLNEASLKKQDAQLRSDLQAKFKITSHQVDQLTSWFREDGEDPQPALPAMVWTDLKNLFGAGAKKRKFARKFKIPKTEVEALWETVSQRALLQRRIARLQKIHKLFHYWHVIHRPFAVIMYVIMLIHIAVALLFAISWR